MERGSEERNTEFGLLNLELGMKKRKPATEYDRGFSQIKISE